MPQQIHLASWFWGDDEVDNFHELPMTHVDIENDPQSSLLKRSLSRKTRSMLLTTTKKSDSCLIKIMYWNARGLANLPTWLVLKKLCVANNPNFLFVAVPWMLLQDFPSSLFNQLGLKAIAVNSRHSVASNLWCLCKIHFSPTLVVVSAQYVTFSISPHNQEIFTFKPTIRAHPICNVVCFV